MVTPEAALSRGVFDTAELLQTSTLASGSPQINANISTAFTAPGDGGNGAESVSLRGLGAIERWCC